MRERPFSDLSRTEIDAFLLQARRERASAIRRAIRRLTGRREPVKS